MRGLWFVFLAACSFHVNPTGVSPDGESVGTDAGSGTQGSPPDDAAAPMIDAREYGPGGGSGSDCGYGRPLIHGGSGHCGHF